MKLLRTSSCCCCANLRTGGLIIGILSLFGSISNAGLFGAHGQASCVIGLLAWGAWLYGIHKNRTSWMLPAVILVIYALIMLLIFLVLIPILGMVFIDNLQHFLDKIAQKNHQAPVDGTLVLSILWVFFAIITVIHWYVSAVTFSLYKSMKEDEISSVNKFNTFA